MRRVQYFRYTSWKVQIFWYIESRKWHVYALLTELSVLYRFSNFVRFEASKIVLESRLAFLKENWPKTLITLRVYHNFHTGSPDWRWVYDCGAAMSLTPKPLCLSGVSAAAHPPSRLSTRTCGRMTQLVLCFHSTSAEGAVVSQLSRRPPKPPWWSGVPAAALHSLSP